MAGDADGTIPVGPYSPHSGPEDPVTAAARYCADLQELVNEVDTDVAALMGFTGFATTKV